MIHTSKLQLICAAVILAIGVGSIWGFGLGGILSTLQSMFWTDQIRHFETVVTDWQGQPFIQAQTGNYYVEYEYRTLAGDPVEMTNENALSPGAAFGPISGTRFIPRANSLA